ncbi:ABC transporter ATP-binding protein [Plantactinospora solaniradicis]|uniref:ABC transporter ATP-binding protein n=1 Tax=Plantactinospora solaniradicis TaxID=1723736 RepID=A0ABW1K0V3_9ACTN
MTAVLRAQGLTKMYGRHPGLIDADLNIPAGRVVGLVGPNGAGKSTLLGMTCGLIEPTSGTIEVLGDKPAANAAQLARVGFVAQDTPVYSGLTVADHLRLGAHLNKNWDDALARHRVQQLGMDPAQRAGALSGGQRAQLALTIAVAKRPELIIFDEPVAALDPLARRQFLQNLMAFISESGINVILSSHLLSDLERVCDYLILLAGSRVQLAGDVDELISTHHRIVGPEHAFRSLPPQIEIIGSEYSGQRTTLVVRRTESTPIPQSMHAEHLDLEELVLAYMTRAANASFDPQQGARALQFHR